MTWPPRSTSQARPLVNRHATDTPPPLVRGCGVLLSGTDPDPAMGVRAGDEAGPGAGWIPEVTAGGRGDGVNMSVLVPLARTMA
jgi:hypothetical protein